MTNSTAKKMAKLLRLEEQGKLSANGYRHLRELREYAYAREGEDEGQSDCAELVVF